jgi:hypothetical protein
MTFSGTTPMPDPYLPPEYGDPALRLQHKLTARVEVVETYAAGRVPIRVAADGYQFPWGQVVERPGMLWVWDFYLERLREAFVARDLGLVALQEQVFATLEARTEYALREHAVTWEALSRDAAGWKIVPAALGRGAAFSVLCHFGATQRLRNWLVGEFLPEILPETQQAVLDGLAHA